jgi:hypothetical protein
VLALGLPPDRAREIAQTAWTKLMESALENFLASAGLDYRYGGHVARV